MKEKILAPLKSFPCFVLFMYLLGLIDMMSIHQGGKHVSVFELLVDIYVLSFVFSLLRLPYGRRDSSTSLPMVLP